jgi:hypothetical protein
VVYFNFIFVSSVDWFQVAGCQLLVPVRSHVQRVSDAVNDIGSSDEFKTDFGSIGALDCIRLPH